MADKEKTGVEKLGAHEKGPGDELANKTPNPSDALPKPSESADQGARADANALVTPDVAGWLPQLGKAHVITDPHGNNPIEIPVEVFVQHQQNIEKAINDARAAGIIPRNVGDPANPNQPMARPVELDIRRAGEEMAKQPKETIVLQQNPYDQEQLPDEEVRINGYTFQIQRGVPVNVPRSVYEVLVQAGRIYPKNAEDAKMFPVVSPAVARRLQATGSGGV